ncbi:hypothetical protein GO986_18745 [Deinococcus sp. HMF7620]|uniref:Phage portal protein n=1 Tax=Deinococcus arboris TaxID=2682977 RepID=A0A7C9LT57_9DEIO|nr:hypothetical protein [Deinococcus arboris]MVN88781.1 hypothetical protein [Deinococcus arboris]
MKYLTLNPITAGLTDLVDAAKVGLGAVALQARHMYNGYHLGEPVGGGEMNFAYWRGPMVRVPDEGTETEKRRALNVVSEFQTALRRSFTSTNVTKEVVRRDVTSSSARMSWTLMQPGVTRAQDTDRTDLEQEADALATSWWSAEIEKAIRAGLTFARREGRGVLRFRVAGGLLQLGEDQVLRVRAGSKPTDIARYVRLECLTTPENARIWEDPDTLTMRAVYTYQDAQKRECVEVSAVDDQDGLTHLRILRGSDDQAASAALDLGGHVHYLQLAAEPLITAQFLQNQMAYNTTSTMILRNTELAGFLERYGINVEPPYEVVDDPDRPGQTKRVYKSPRLGPGSMTLWRQSTIAKADAEGEYQGDQPLGTAQYGRFEPVSPQALITAAEHSQLNMYSEVGQTFVLMGKDATVSGRSREVAIADFDTIREETVLLAQAAVRGVVTTFLALVAALSGQPRRYALLDVQGTVRSRTVPPSPEDRRADREDVAGGVISKATARQRQGLDDPAQEDAQIEREKPQEREAQV